MLPQNPQKRRLAVIIGIIVVFVGGTLYLVFSNTGNNANVATSGGETSTYHDPVSGEDIVTQKDKAPEGLVSSPTIPTFAGFDELLKMGITLSQLHSLYAAYEQNDTFASNKVIVSLAPSSLTPVDPQDSDPQYRRSITGKMVTTTDKKQTPYHVQMYYWGTNTAQLVVYDEAGTTQIFDSGPLNTSDYPDIP